jgi:hypothetical protein
MFLPKQAAMHFTSSARVINLEATLPPEGYHVIVLFL